MLDSVGIGELPDASAYGDQGSNTLGNIAKQVPLKLPTLRRLGFERVAALGGVPAREPAVAAVGRMAEASAGKDSVTGHWEMMGVVLDRPFPVFPDGFPRETLAQFSRQTGRGVLGNKAASGTQIIEELGAEHMRTGAFIVYTSADSVFQIAAHERSCRFRSCIARAGIAYKLVCEGLGVGRVIARPFVGKPGAFHTNVKSPRLCASARRRNIAGPHEERIARGGGDLGKVDDLFAGRGVTHAIHTATDDEAMDHVVRQIEQTDHPFIFVNLVDFDTQYGHRNDVHGYARNLERFDARLAELLPRLRRDDLLIVTADHGNDPTTPSTDHSREYVPLIVTGERVRRGVDLGTRLTFADLGQTLAQMFDVGPLAHGTSFLHEIAA